MKLSVELLVTNEGASAVTLDQVTVSFLGPPFAVPVSYEFDKSIGTEERSA